MKKILLFIIVFMNLTIHSGAPQYAKTQVISDVEGSWARLTSQADLVPGKVQWNLNPAPLHTHVHVTNSPAALMIRDDNVGFLRNDSRIRFLGDTTDNGPENEKVLKFIIDLKERYPDRVELIIGNRDLNKLRFLTELTPEALILEGDDIFRDDRFRLTEWKDKFDKWIKDGKNKIDGAIVAYQHGRSPVTDKILKMKWMLDDTMGAGRLFEYVKKEKGFATDLQTFQELMRWIQPDGLWGRYLTLGNIIHEDADIGTIYMHGGISDTNLGVVPGQGGIIENISEWIVALNAWGTMVIRAAFANDLENAILGIQYQEPLVIVTVDGQSKWNGPNPISVIQVRPWTTDYNLKALDIHVAEKLKKQGIKYVCSGHSPIGQIAVMIQAANGVMSVLCDTSATMPLRGSTIIFADGNVTIYSTVYLDDGSSRRVVSSSADPRVGIPTDGLLTISDVLDASWSRAKSGAPYGEPAYHFKKIAPAHQESMTPGK